MYLSPTLLIIGVSGLVLLGTGTGVGVYFWVMSGDDDLSNASVGAVVTNGHECAQIGADVLKEQGSAVDAAVAALFCEGIAQPQSMGLGGGFFMTIYIRKNKTVETLDARETASEMASENMYNGNASLAAKGGLAVAVPGELMGYWDAHKKYGKLPWARLIRPSIDLCKNGHVVTKFLANLLKKQEPKLLDSPTLREIFIDPMTNQSYLEGQLIKRLDLVNTLELIANGTAAVLYDGSLTKPFIDDVTELGGILTVNDMKNYRTKWHPPVTAKLDGNLTLYSTPLPGSGIILSFILNILTGFLDAGKIDTDTNWHKIMESFKFGYAKRTELGDPDFVDGIEDLIANLTSLSYSDAIRAQILLNQTYQDPKHYGANFSLPDDHGTAHLSVLAPNGDAVSVTSTINQYFGAGIRSRRTGIVLNDEMDDFSAPNITNGFGLPPSPANFIVPHKRPMSSMCPSIITDKNGDVVLVIGAAGGTKITTSVVQVALRTLLFGQSLQEAVDGHRLHHQLVPMWVSAEQNFNKDVLEGLRRRQHVVKDMDANDGFAAVTAISRLSGKIEGSFDSRRTGSISYV